LLLLGRCTQNRQPCRLQICRCPARGKKAASRVTPAFFALGEGYIPMIAVCCDLAQCVSARCLGVCRERSYALSRIVGGCGVESVRGQGPTVFGKCAKDCFSLGGPLSHRPTSFYIHGPRLFTSVFTPAQPLSAVDCFNERAMTTRYDPEQVTHPLDVAQSAAWVGGASGTYRLDVAFPHARIVCLSRAPLYTYAPPNSSPTASDYCRLLEPELLALSCQAISRVPI
jgi:hypothetical protein